jgi:hypothetical protein
MPPAIRTFFESYREAFNRLDGEAVARLYAVPSGIVSDRGYTHWSSFEPIVENMVALCKLYGESGFASTTFEPVAFIAQGEELAVADVSWDHRTHEWARAMALQHNVQPHAWRGRLARSLVHGIPREEAQ